MQGVLNVESQIITSCCAAKCKSLDGRQAAVQAISLRFAQRTITHTHACAHVCLMRACCAECAQRSCSQPHRSAPPWHAARACSRPVCAAAMLQPAGQRRAS
eukprot:670280-Pelagomonas_calceolata.AAC.1